VKILDDKIYLNLSFASDLDYWMTGPEAKEHGMLDEVLGNTD
jgi:ATP-dependent protease ClpP protease subunit